MSASTLVSRARLGLLFASVALLAACGGGGGGDDTAGPAPAPPPSAPLTLADCDAKPLGLENSYLNSARPLRKWVAGQFEGVDVVVREEYDAAGVISRRIFYRDDAAARTSELVARNWYDANGQLERSIRFSGAVLPTDLAPGESETVTYTWQVRSPVGEPDGRETLTLRYDGNQAVTLRGGRIDTCKTTISIADANGDPVSTETVHAARGASFVKSYLKSTAAGVVDSGQTYMIELDESTATLRYTAPTVSGTPPSLAACSALPAGLDFTLSAADDFEADSARRRTELVTWRGGSSLAMRRSNGTSGSLQSTTHFDPNIGLLATLGFESANGASGILLSRAPDLRTTPLGGSVDFVETATTYPGGASSTTNQTFTFHGHERVSTPAGSFDACKVTLRVNAAGGYSDTYWLAPGQGFVRSESVDALGKRSTRERLTP